MHTDPTTCAARTQHKSALQVLFCVLFAIGAAKGTLTQDEGNSDSPDAAARNTEIPLSSDQYLSAVIA